MPHQRLVILQGAPGSGKSSVAKYLSSQDERTVVVSTDDFCHGPDGRYQFDPKRAAERHKAAQDKVAFLLKAGLSCVVDNTNIKAWEAKPYVAAALALNIPVYFVRCSHRFKNTHGVPDEKVQFMRSNMDDLTVESVMAASPPWEKK